MIDLDALEKDAYNCFWSYGSDSQGYPEPDDVVALVRVVRAALAFTDSPDNVAGWTPHTEAYAALVASVEPFRP